MPKSSSRLNTIPTYSNFVDDAANAQCRADAASVIILMCPWTYNGPVEQPLPVQQAQSQSNPKLQLKPQSNNGNCQLIVGLIDTAIQPPSAGISSVVMPPVSVVGNYTPDPGQLTHGTAMMDMVAAERSP